MHAKPVICANIHFRFSFRSIGDLFSRAGIASKAPRLPRIAPHIRAFCPLHMWRPNRCRAHDRQAPFDRIAKQPYLRPQVIVAARALHRIARRRKHVARLKNRACLACYAWARLSYSIGLEYVVTPFGDMISTRVRPAYRMRAQSCATISAACDVENVSTRVRPSSYVRITCHIVSPFLFGQRARLRRVVIHGQNVAHF